MRFLTIADEDTEGKKLKARFKLIEDGTSPYKKKDEWGATVVEEEGGKQKLELSVYIPGDAVVGEWDVKVLVWLADSSPHSLPDRLVGLVVKASASRAEGPGFESRLRRDFFGV